MFSPEARDKTGPNWMYFYDKARDEAAHAGGTGGAVRVIFPDDEWHAAEPEGGGEYTYGLSFSRFPSMFINEFQTTVPNKKAYAYIRNIEEIYTP